MKRCGDVIQLVLLLLLFAHSNSTLKRTCVSKPNRLANHSIKMPVHAQVLAALLPGRVSALPDLGLIPRPKPIDTRMVGSWVCPALLTGGKSTS